RIEVGQQRVEDGVAELLKRDAPPVSPQDLLNPAVAVRLFGPTVRVVDLARIVSASQADVDLYYRGAPLTWNIILANGDIERDRYTELLNLLMTPSNRTRMVCLIGEPGAGKTTLAWRLAAESALSLQLPILQFRDNEADDAWYML